MGSADEIAKAAVFPASDDSIFVTGIELFVDGGASSPIVLSKCGRYRWALEHRSSQPRTTEGAPRAFEPGSYKKPTVVLFYRGATCTSSSRNYERLVLKLCS
jgi:hypothetical protein